MKEVRKCYPFLNEFDLATKQGIAPMALKNGFDVRDFELLVQDLDEISKNMMCYFDYCEKRETLLNDLLRLPSLN